MRKRVKAAVLTALMLLCMVFVSTPASAEEPTQETAFSGSRTVTFIADSSDISNYFDGGRTALDLMLRIYSPSWLNCSLRSSGRDVVLSMTFSFDSAEQYFGRMEELLTYDPEIMYTQKVGLVLTEDCQPVELLNFAQQMVEEKGENTSYTLTQLLTLQTHTMEINGTQYTFGDEPVRILPEAELDLQLRLLEITTVENEDGEFERTVTLESTQANTADWDTMVKRFKKEGDIAESSQTQLTACLSGADLQEIVDDTMYCIGSPVCQEKMVLSNNGKRQTVQRTEMYVLDGVMAENGTFMYSYEYPDYYENVAAVGTSVSVSDTSIRAYNDPYIRYEYQQVFQFAEAYILADFTNPLGKVKKSIVLTAPAEEVMPFHEYLKKDLEKKLTDGTVLNIYDNEGIRYYEITFSSWFAEDMEAFTRTVQGGNTGMVVKDSWFPFGKSSLTEQIRSTKILPGAVPAEKTTVCYIFPRHAKVDVQNQELEVLTQERGTIALSIGASDEVQLTYRRLHLTKLLVELVILLVGILMVLYVVSLIRRLVAKLKAKRQDRGLGAVSELLSRVTKPLKQAETAQAYEPKDQPEEDTFEPVEEVSAPVLPEQEVRSANRFCGQCGAPCEPDQVFCGACGARLDG